MFVLINSVWVSLLVNIKVYINDIVLFIAGLKRGLADILMCLLVQKKDLIPI